MQQQLDRQQRQQQRRRAEHHQHAGAHAQPAPCGQQQAGGGGAEDDAGQRIGSAFAGMDRAREDRDLQRFAKGCERHEDDHRGGRRRAFEPGVEEKLNAAPDLAGRRAHAHGHQQHAGGHRGGEGGFHAAAEFSVDQHHRERRRGHQADRQAPADAGDQVAAAGLAQIGGEGADDEDELRDFPQRDGECVEHVRPPRRATAPPR